MGNRPSVLSTLFADEHTRVIGILARARSREHRQDRERVLIGGINTARDPRRRLNRSIRAGLDSTMSPHSRRLMPPFYFQPGVYEKLRARPNLLARALRSIAAAPGVQRVFRSDELATATTASDVELRAAALSYFAGRSGDVIVSLKPGWIAGGMAATHGSGNADDQRVPVVFLGPWFQPGTYDEAITPADIAPTLAYISGVTLSRAEGHPLLQAIAGPRHGNLMPAGVGMR